MSLHLLPVRHYVYFVVDKNVNPKILVVLYFETLQISALFWAARLGCTLDISVLAYLKLYPMDNNVKYALCFVFLLNKCFGQTIAICWVFGARKFYGCIEQMIGYKVHSSLLNRWSVTGYTGVHWSDDRLQGKQRSID